MVRTATLTLLLFSASHLVAQDVVKVKIKSDCPKSGAIAVGGMAGFGFSNGSVWSKHERLSTGMLVTPRIGVVAEFETAQKLFIQPSIAYNTYGYWITPGVNTSKVSVRVRTFEFPLNIQYKLGGANERGIFFGAGAYYGVTVSAVKTDNFAPKSKTELIIGPDKSDDIARSMFGWTVNAGYQMANGIFFRAAWQNGVSDYIPGNQGASYHPYQANVSVGYLFKMAKPRTAKIDTVIKATSKS